MSGDYKGVEGKDLERCEFITTSLSYARVMRDELGCILQKDDDVRITKRSVYIVHSKVNPVKGKQMKG